MRRVSPAIDAAGRRPPPRRSYGCAFVVDPCQRRRWLADPTPPFRRHSTSVFPMGWRRKRDERPPIDVVGAEPGDERLTTIAVGRSGPSRSKAPYVVALAVATLVGGLVLGGGGDADDTAAAEAATHTPAAERPARPPPPPARDPTTTRT